MKICFKLSLLFLSQLLAIHFNIFLITMCVLNIKSSFSHYGVEGKCIHDNIDWNMQKINPQLYDMRLIQSKKNLNPTTKMLTTTESTPKLITTNPLLTTEYLYSNHKISRSEEIVISTSNIKRTTRQISSDSDYSNLENDDISLVTNNNIIYVDESENSDLYENIRIKVWYDYERISFNNESVEFSRLKMGLDRAIEKIQNLFSVVPIRGSLILSRHDICQGIWSDPNLPNFGRCGQIDQSYNGESCLDDFKIPDNHLSGFVVYNRNGSEPMIVHYLNGSGIPNTDTVIYVRSDSTSRCANGDTVAYAKFCQLDQFNRPLAGFANFCPNHLLNENYDEEKFYLTVLHELFHVLGFSNSLFDKFQQCTNQPVGQEANNLLPGQEFTRVCEQRGTVVDFVNDWYRILSPAVSRESNEHFNCSDIKGPLEGSEEQPKITSHWESRFMQPSLMTSSIGLPHLTVLDRMTLAVFEDSGWYRVDYSKADELFWGKDAGCEFGTRSYCTSQKSPFFCTAANVVNGCHYLHMDKGVCKSTDFLDSCKIYKPDKDSGCWKQPGNDESDPVLSGEVYNINSRCFISNLSAESTTENQHHVSRRSLKEEGRCYEHRCNNTNTLEIRVRGSAWIVCPQNSYRKVPGYDGKIRCPSARVICSAEFSGVKFAKAVSDVCAMVNISFKGLQKFLTSPLQGNETRESRYKEFRKKLTESINNLVEGNGSEVGNQHMILRGETIGFSIKTNSSSDDNRQSGGCYEAIRRIKVAVEGNIFSVVVGDVELMANQFNVKYNLKMCGPNDDKDDEGDDHSNIKPSTKSPPSGVVGAITVGAVCTLVFASVGGILYWKNTIPRSIAPTVSSVEVAYQNTARASPSSPSECGSVGQIEFPV